jgi:fructose-bisphosphate aldolase class II
VTKININTDMRVAFRHAVEKVLKENPNEFALVKLMDEVKDAVQVVVEEKLAAFNAVGKAVK